ncbi:MAG: hypothetical protein R2942_01720 [Ignavibacteria bacterium]
MKAPKYLGEAALVDKRLKVHKSGLIFNSILYDVLPAILRLAEGQPA